MQDTIEYLLEKIGQLESRIEELEKYCYYSEQVDNPFVMKDENIDDNF